MNVSFNSVLSNLPKRLQEIIEDDRIVDPLVELDRIVASISVDDLALAAGMNPLEEAKQLFEEAKIYLELNGGDPVSNRMSVVLDSLIACIETIVTAFGIGDFFSPAENFMQGEAKFQKIGMLVSFFSMLTSLLLPILGAAGGAQIVGGILLVIAALSLIWPRIKPMTTHLPGNAENWTKQIQSGGSRYSGRKEVLDEIASILARGQHPILIGPSRVGKSLTAKAFAGAIERGDYPELNGKNVFRINTSELVGESISLFGDEGKVLQNISNTMGRHRKNIILVLDEIHMACKEGERAADKLKTFLDEGGDFPHVIGISTDEEYKDIEKNGAFSLRFSPVKIESMTREETIRTLAEYALSHKSQPLVKEGALAHLYEVSQKENSPQPISALKLLKRCIQKTKKAERTATENKIVELSTKIASLHAENALTKGKHPVKELEIQKETMLKDQRKEKEDCARIYRTKQWLNHTTKEAYSLAIKLSSSGALDNRLLKRFLMLRAYFEKELESSLEMQSKKLKLKLFIDKELIDEIAASNS